ncbi:MAG: VOC family protein [Chloroflexi bacterium]|nr:VOC family protein [Chloroflexota bacterium]MCY3587683.1 VOC family protein [Chloroflexota bacterium]MCY3686300.1 VOC family protein [Chloroflexota bacterium]MDE2708921.1 VOC family protein [Chloroflexota bacterium]
MLDHIVLATPDVQATVDEIAAATGVRAGLGGRFTQMGAYNHLLALQDGAYLEIIGPDPEHQGGGSMPFGLDPQSGRGAHIPHWCWKGNERIDELAYAARTAGYDLGDVVPLGRDLPDGGRLDWRLTIGTWPPHLGGLIPFLIDWGDAPHPSTTAVQGVTLASWHGEHPDLDTVRAAHQVMGIEIDLREANGPALVATFQGPEGSITYR